MDGPPSSSAPGDDAGRRERGVVARDHAIPQRCRATGRAAAMSEPVMLTPVSPPMYLVPEEAGELLRLSAKSVYRLAKADPTFPVVRLGAGRNASIRIPRAPAGLARGAHAGSSDAPTDARVAQPRVRS